MEIDDRSKSTFFNAEQSMSFKLLVFVVAQLSLSFILSTQLKAQTTVNFTEFPINTEIGEKYVNKGLLFSSREGVPIVSQDNLITGKFGL